MKWKRNSDETPLTPVERRVALVPSHDLVNATESTIYALGRAIHTGDWDDAEIATETISALIDRLRKL